jgi:hypothetical protein
VVGGTDNNFLFSSIDLSDYSTSNGSTLTFVGSSGNYALNNVLRLSTANLTDSTLYNQTYLQNFSEKISFSDANLRASITFDGGYTTLTVAAIPDARVYTAAAFLIVLIGVTEYRRRRRPCRR